MPSFLGVERGIAESNLRGRFREDGSRVSDGMELGLLPACHTVTGPLLVNHGLGIMVAASGSLIVGGLWASRA